MKPGFDQKSLSFGGTARRLAEEEFDASFNGDRDRSSIDGLYAEYEAAGSPADTEGWLRERLATLFAVACERPKWIERLPMWPFLDGKPMVFVGQMRMPDTDVATNRLATSVELYVFGARVELENGWETTYSVVEQHDDLP